MPNKTPYLRQNQASPADIDYKSTVVVAGIWFLFYSLMVGGALMTYRVSEFVAQGI